jgi:hypothetical protein
MNKIAALTLAAGIALGGGAFVAGPAQAQDAPHPPPPGMMGGPGGPGGPGGMMREGGPGGMMREHGPGRPWRFGRMMHRMREFALIYPAPDRNLSGPDVQKIAEAFLLFQGNHTWKVTEVKEEPNRVTFALATPDGTAIAHFAMDRHTARPERLD